MSENREIDFLKGLNSEQKLAVTSIAGPILIVAGAGSGKTTVLTKRIAFMIENKVEASKILALTFTKKAAIEMKERVANVVTKRKARDIVMGTFHAIFVRFLRQYAESLGYTKDFTIYDQSDAISLIKTTIKELKLDDKEYKPKEVLSKISKVKNNLFTAEHYAQNQGFREADARAKKPMISAIYSLYARKCKAANVMDFDDILLNMSILLKSNPQALGEISACFDYILVDEYQDTNYAQYYILQKLAQRHRNIAVVGDDSQSIYAFRGADISNILNFKKDYPEAQIIRLETNYRSTQVIVNAANSVIEKNEGRIPKVCRSAGEEGEKIKLLCCFTEQEEGLLLAQEIKDLVCTEGCEYADFAILYRTNSQSRAIEEALKKKQIPYRIYSGNSFFERAEIKDMMAYLKLVVNPNDDESFKRVVNKPARGIGNTTLDALTLAAREQNISLYKAVFSEKLSSYGLKEATINKLKMFCSIIDMAKQKETTAHADEIVSFLAQSSSLLASFKADLSVESQTRAANIEELVSAVVYFVEDKIGEMKTSLAEEDGLDVDLIDEAILPKITISQFLEETSLLSNVDVDEEDDRNKVSLMTIHASKGLEYTNIYIVGAEENIFPSGGFYITPKELEEERRLFYVALTRAKKKVTLSFAKNRKRNGRDENNMPSRFIGEICPSFIQNPSVILDAYGSSENDDLHTFVSGSRTLSSGFGSRSSSPGGFGSRSSSLGGFSSRSSSPGGFGSRTSSLGGFGSRAASSSSFAHSGSGKSFGARASSSNNFASSSSGRSFGSRTSSGSSFSRLSMEEARTELSTRARFSSNGVLPKKPLSKVLPDKIPDSEFIPSPPHLFKVGDRIEHNRFSFGIIKELIGKGEEAKARIVFEKFGEKIIMLRSSKLRVPLDK